MENYWQAVLDLLESLFGIDIQQSPLTFLLGSPLPRLKKHGQKLANLANLILTTSRRVMARNWKKPQLPTATELKTAIQDIRRMEYMAALHNSHLSNYEKVWSPWDILHPPTT
ncbi:hypothetical protein XELAEV_18010307mg [Xenopus laevis]|uniref:Uncharacterized protein n=1 Tax=Xenopus laevis TaxID=8355 RepID=A0A974DTW2_XENLA|nr:hypothetical protein XELAEV_18010307mg [Xenopus laevis]